MYQEAQVDQRNATFDWTESDGPESVTPEGYNSTSATYFDL